MSRRCLLPQSSIHQGFPWSIYCRQVSRSLARADQSSGKPQMLISSLAQSFKGFNPFRDLPLDCLLLASSPNRSCFGILLQSILQTWPSHRSRFDLIVASMELQQALLRTSAFVMCCHHLILRIRRSERW